MGRNYNAAITKCYSTGTSSREGFSGYNNGTISSCFWDTQTSGKTSSNGGTAKTYSVSGTYFTEEENTTGGNSEVSYTSTGAFDATSTVDLEPDGAMVNTNCWFYN